MITYSYVIQGLSRLLFIVLYRYRNLLNYKCHVILIICQTLASFLMQFLMFTTGDVLVRSLHECIILPKTMIQVIFMFASSFLIPLVITVIIYGFIYYRVTQSSVAVRQSSHPTKRDLGLMRNILIFVTLFIVSGIPIVIHLIITSKGGSVSGAFHMFTLVTTSIIVAIEKICLLFINKEIRKEIKKLSRKLHPARTSDHPDVQSVSLSNVVNSTIVRTATSDL
jgi:hypothetical protein